MAQILIEFICKKCGTEQTPFQAQLTDDNKYRDHVDAKELKCKHCEAPLKRPKLVMSYLIEGEPA